MVIDTMYRSDQLLWMLKFVKLVHIKLNWNTANEFALYGRCNCTIIVDGMS